MDKDNYSPAKFDFPSSDDDDDSLIDDLLAGNAALQALVAKSKAGVRKSFVRSGG